MNVLSLFDGISCGMIALERAGIEVDKYYASEIDKYAAKVSEANYPDIIRLGDVADWREWDIDWPSIDLLIGGSPCQGFSFAGKQLAFYQPCRASERGRRLVVCGTRRDDRKGEIARGYECATDGKTSCLTTVQKDNYICEDYMIRKLTPIECERLQTVPDNYTAHVSNTQRYKMLGNGWTVDVIAHIFRSMSEN